MRDRNLHRCTATEVRSGRTVRCTLGETHYPQHPHMHGYMLFTPTSAQIEEANAAPVCGRSWQEPHPLDGEQMYDAETGTWSDVITPLGHVCYEVKGHGSDHLCWCGCTAVEQRKPAVVTPITAMRPRQTMLRSAA